MADHGEDFAFNVLRQHHKAELKRRGMKATSREELVPEQAMMSHTKEGKSLHSAMGRGGKPYHMVLDEDMKEID